MSGVWYVARAGVCFLSADPSRSPRVSTEPGLRNPALEGKVLSITPGRPFISRL